MPRTPDNSCCTFCGMNCLSRLRNSVEHHFAPAMFMQPGQDVLLQLADFLQDEPALFQLTWRLSRPLLCDSAAEKAATVAFLQTAPEPVVVATLRHCSFRLPELLASLPQSLHAAACRSTYVQLPHPQHFSLVSCEEDQCALARAVACLPELHDCLSIEVIGKLPDSDASVQPQDETMKPALGEQLVAGVSSLQQLQHLRITLATGPWDISLSGMPLEIRASKLTLSVLRVLQKCTALCHVSFRQSICKAQDMAGFDASMPSVLARLAELPTLKQITVAWLAGRASDCRSYGAALAQIHQLQDLHIKQGNGSALTFFIEGLTAQACPQLRLLHVGSQQPMLGPVLDLRVHKHFPPLPKLMTLQNLAMKVSLESRFELVAMCSAIGALTALTNLELVMAVSKNQQDASQTGEVLCRLLRDMRLLQHLHIGGWLPRPAALWAPALANSLANGLPKVLHIEAPFKEGQSAFNEADICAVLNSLNPHGLHGHKVMFEARAYGVDSFREGLTGSELVKASQRWQDHDVMLLASAEARSSWRVGR